MHLFDNGYEKLRDTIFANQKKLGVIPKDTKLDAVAEGSAEAWDQLTADERSCSSGRSKYSPRTPRTATTKSAVSSRPSRTSASSTTR